MSLCAKTQCDTVLDNGCTSCITGFQLNGPSPNNCVLKNQNYLGVGVNRYQPIGKSPDLSSNIGGNATMSLLTIKLNGVATTAASNCNKNANIYYTFYGNLGNSDVISVSCPAVVDRVFYWKVRIIYWFITINSWDSSSIISTNFNMTSTSTTTSLNTMADSDNVCSGGAD